MYSNDIDRGIDTYLFEGDRAAVSGNDMWFNGTDAIDAFGVATLPADYQMYCLLKGSGPTDAVITGLVAGL